MSVVPCRLKYKICTPHSAATVVRRIRSTKGLRDGWNSRPGSKKLHPRDNTLPLSKTSSSCSPKVPYHQHDYSSRMEGRRKEGREKGEGEQGKMYSSKKLDFMLKYQEGIGFMHRTGIVLAFFKSIRMPQSGLGAKNSVGPGELRALGRRIIKKGGNNFQAGCFSPTILVLPDSDTLS